MTLNNFIPFAQVFVVNFIIFTFLALISLRFLKPFFPVSINTSRSALTHPPTLRGIGIIFPICLVISSFILSKNYQLINSYFLLIFLSTLIGFYDDLKNINYKVKIISLISLFIIILSIDNDVLVLSDINIFFSIPISITCFIFFILFFNQIDGINGLSSGTFCVFLGSIIFLKYNEIVPTEIFIHVLGIVFAYFILNIFKVRFFQGDAGAYFLGSVSYVMFQESEKIFFVSFIFLFPLLGDVIWTALMRLYLGYNLLESHKTHLYQKSVSKLKAHFPVTLSNILIQLICFFIVYFFYIYNESLLIQLIFLVLAGLFFSLIYIFTSYFFNKSK